MLEDIKSMSSYLFITSDDMCNKLADILIMIFNKNFIANKHSNNQKNLINIFQIISTLVIQSENLKEALIQNNFWETLKSNLSNNKFDSVLEYQAKGN